MKKNESCNVRAWVLVSTVQNGTVWYGKVERVGGRRKSAPNVHVITHSPRAFFFSGGVRFDASRQGWVAVRLRLSARGRLMYCPSKIPYCLSKGFPIAASPCLAWPLHLDLCPLRSEVRCTFVARAADGGLLDQSARVEVR